MLQTAHSGEDSSRQIRQRVFRKAQIGELGQSAEDPIGQGFKLVAVQPEPLQRAETRKDFRGEFAQPVGIQPQLFQPDQAVEEGRRQGGEGVPAEIKALEPA